MANVPHCDRCGNAITTSHPRALSMELLDNHLQDVDFVPMDLATRHGVLLLPLKINLTVQQANGDDKWKGVDLCTVCFLAVLRVFYAAHCGEIGGAK